MSADWQKVTKSLHEFYFQILRIDYFLDPLTESQDVERWEIYQRMTDDLISLFSSLLEAQKKPVLTNQQIHDLVSSLLPLFSDKQISADLIESFADIKIALIGKSGSSAGQWVPADLVRIQKKLPVLFTEIQKIFKVLKQINSSGARPWKTSYEEFERLENEFNASVGRIIDILDGPYDLSAAQMFLKNIEASQILTDFKLPAKFESYYKVALSLKYMVTGVQSAEVTNPELKHIVKLLGTGYFHFLEYGDYLKPFKFQEKNLYKSFENFQPKN